MQSPTDSLRPKLKRQMLQNPREVVTAREVTTISDSEEDSGGDNEEQAAPKAESFNEIKRARALTSLADGEWLNNSAIELLLDCVSDETVLILDTTFPEYAKAGKIRRLSKATALLRYIILPQEAAEHWTGAIIDVPRRRIEIVNSLTAMDGAEPGLIEAATLSANYVLNIARLSPRDWRIVKLV